jgi:2-iminobutanoate/2-iminopropanoate deaminase
MSKANAKGEMVMEKVLVVTDKAPAAVGPYTQAIKIGELVYTSGQIGLVPGTGELAGEEVEVQAEQVLQNLQAVLQAAGTDLAHVVKTTVFLRYMKDYKAVNEVYARHFGAHPPARSAVAVAGLPLGAKVEIEAVAIVPLVASAETTDNKAEAEPVENGVEAQAEALVSQALGAVDTAVANGLRKLSNFLAEVEQRLQKEKGEEQEKEKEKGEKPKKKGSKK